MARKKIQKAPESKERLNGLMYTVLYPAFLGSFLFGMLSADKYDIHFAWGILLCIYFALQQVEGTLSFEEDKSYRKLRFVGDLGEIALMAIGFDNLGLFPSEGTNHPAEPTAISVSLTAIFFWPIILRLLLSCEKIFDNQKNWHFYMSLTLLSAAASVLSFNYNNGFAFAGVAILLFVYAVFFQIWNEHWFKEKPCYCRRIE